MNIHELVDKFTALRSEIDAHIPVIDADPDVASAKETYREINERTSLGSVGRLYYASKLVDYRRDAEAQKIPGLWEKVTELRKLREEITRQLKGPF